jgi:hypothetical protein
MTSFNGALVIREHKGRAFYEAKWRDSRGRQVKRRVVGAFGRSPRQAAPAASRASDSSSTSSRA